MRLISKFALAALAGLFVANFAPQASAQNAARDAAIHKLSTRRRRASPTWARKAPCAPAPTSIGPAWQRRARLLELDSLTLRARERAS
jgi:hypothetical protein